jgi:hypothetical protein
MGLSPTWVYPPEVSRVIRSASSSCPLAFAVGSINATSLGRSARPPQSTGPLLQQRGVVSALDAPTTRSASLDDSHGRPRSTGYTIGLCPTTWSGLPPRPSPLWVNAPSLRAIIPTPGGEAVTPQSRHHPQRLATTESGVSSSTTLTPIAVRGDLTTLQGSLHAMARRVACPPVRVRPGGSSAHNEDVYVRAFPRAFPRPVTRTSSQISLHSLFGERLWPDCHRLERCSYGLCTLLINSKRPKSALTSHIGRLARPSLLSGGIHS